MLERDCDGQQYSPLKNKQERRVRSRQGSWSPAVAEVEVKGRRVVGCYDRLLAAAAFVASVARYHRENKPIVLKQRRSPTDHPGGVIQTVSTCDDSRKSLRRNW